jgi:hypothetical protein
VCAALGVPIEILLVEANAGDGDLAREAMEDSKISNTISVASDGYLEKPIDLETFAADIQRHLVPPKEGSKP